MQFAKENIQPDKSAENPSGTASGRTHEWQYDLQYVVVLAALTAAFLLVVGLGPESLPFPPGGQFSDAVVSHWPNALYLQESIRTGHFPLWRDLIMNGQPFSVNPLNKVWYPPQWLVVILPAILHLNLLLWLHLILAGVGMRALALRLGISRGSAGIIGLAYAFTPRLIAAAGAGHLDIVYAAAWMPLLLWSVHRMVVERQRRQNIATVSFIAAMCFLADIRMSIFALTFAFVFGLWLAWQQPVKQRQQLLASMLLCVLLFAALTAVAWMPLLELSSYLSRETLTQADSGVFSLIPGQLVTLIVPNRGGSQETMIYAGGVIFILAILGCMSAFRRRWFWLAVIVVAAWYALGSNSFLWLTLTRLIPPLLWLRVPPRLWFIAIIALLILAGYGLDSLAANQQPSRPVQARQQNRMLSLFGSALVLIVLLLGAAIMGAKQFVAGGMLIGGLGLFGVLLLLNQRLKDNQKMIAVTILIAFELVLMDNSLIQGQSRAVWLDQYEPLARTLIDAHVTRLYSPDYSFPQQAAAYWHIPVFGGVDPFQFKNYVSAFEDATGTHSKGYSVTLPSFDGGDPQNSLKTANQNAVINADSLAHWNVSHVLASFPIDNPDLHLINRPNDFYLYENTRFNPAISITWDGPNQFTATNQSNSPVNVTAWLPLWNVVSNGTAVVVQPGQTIHGTYTVPGLDTAVSLSVGAFLMFLSLRFGRTRRNNRV